MRKGTRKVIFSYLVKHVPEGSNKECGSYAVGEEVIAMLIRDYRADVEAKFMSVFGEYLTQGYYNDAGEYIWSERVQAKTIEEAAAHNSLFKTVDNALKWGAEAMYMSEMQAGIDWLVAEGYIRDHKKPARFGYKYTLSVTPKGWEIAHLYK